MFIVAENTGSVNICQSRVLNSVDRDQNDEVIIHGMQNIKLNAL